jgi:parallel beta-helix repeat protein
MRSGPRHAVRQPGGPRHVPAPRSDRGDLSATSGRRWRRTSITAVGLVLALIAALTLTANAINPPAPEPAPAPALLGAGAQADSGTVSAQQAATLRLEKAIGRQLNIGHSFVPWGADLGGVPAANVAAGRTPMISFGKDSSWRAVAAGRHDRYLAALARSVAGLGRPVLLRYSWGMDSASLRTTWSRGAAYVAAWRHVHELFAAQGVRGFWVWSPNADAFAGARGGVDQYWPGHDYVDWVGADGFNRGSCTDRSTWRDFGPIFKAFYSWGSARAKPLMISSTGTVEDPIDPGRKRGWYLDAAGALGRSMPRIRAVVLLDQGGRCDWRPDTSALSMQGFVDFARDPFFAGAAPTPAPPPPTTRPPTTTVPATSTTVTPTTKAPTTTAPTTTTPTAAPASTCSTSGGVPIATGDDAQRVVDAHGAGTRYTVKAGTHLRNFSVRPKSGDTFCGEPGAVLDGGRTLKTAFSGPATNVTLDSITVQEYNSGWQGGAIHPDATARGWVVRNVSALRNYWAGLMAADGMRILGGHYNDNDQLGISGNAATGIVLDGLDSDPTTFDGPEMARNRMLHVDCGYEAGGMKWDMGQVTVRNARVHDNSCRGLWADGNSHDALIEHNLIDNNEEEGILYEISQDAVIRNNVINRNGFKGSGWYWAGGITVTASFNVEVYGNRLSDNYNGITGIQQDRPDGTPPAHLLDNFEVHDNVICATGGSYPTGVVADNGANLAARDITFSSNTIQSATCRQ